MKDLHVLLQPGRIVVTKEHICYLVTESTIVDSGGFLKFNEYDTNLRLITDSSYNHIYDIIQIYNIQYTSKEKDEMKTIISEEPKMLTSQRSKEFLKYISKLVRTRDSKVSLIYPEGIVASIF